MHLSISSATVVMVTQREGGGERRGKSAAAAGRRLCPVQRCSVESPAPPLTRPLVMKGTFRRVFAWGLDRYGQMGAGGRATKVGVAAQAFNCVPVQVPGLNWAVLTQLGALG